MTNVTVAPVIAGVDGSADARLAVDLAAWEADRRHATLRLVYGFRPVYACDAAAARGTATRNAPVAVVHNRHTTTTFL